MDGPDERAGALGEGSVRPELPVGRPLRGSRTTQGEAQGPGEQRKRLITLAPPGFRQTRRQQQPALDTDLLKLTRLGRLYRAEQCRDKRAQMNQSVRRSAEHDNGER